MDDPGVNTSSPQIYRSLPQNGVITIQDDSDVIMLSPDVETPPIIVDERPADVQISISDDDPEERTTNLEEIVISEDDVENNDCEEVQESQDESEVTDFCETIPKCMQQQDDDVLQTQNEEKSITVTFSSEEVLHEYKQIFSAFLHTFKDFTYLEDANKLIVTTDATLKEYIVVNSIPNESDGGVDCGIDQNAKKHRRKEHEQSQNNEENLFTLDTDPSSEIVHCPIYKSKYKLLDDIEVEEQSEEKSQTENKMTCFNCSGEHTLRMCPLPKDNRRIKLARGKVPKLIRYHEESNNKYNNLKPGVLSDTLKKALGVRKYELPPHVYKMRVMGYPPGWLEEAKVFHSNLTLFDSDGNEDASSKAGCGYSINPDKIVDYPGFNCKPERGCRDEYNFYRVPPYSTALSKENMIEFVNRSQQQENHQSDQATACQVNSRSKSPSPSLTDLEQQKRQLLEQLTTNDDSNTSNTPNDTPVDTPADTLMEAEPPEMPTNDTDLSVIDMTLDTSSANPENASLTPSTPVAKVREINSSLPGTPIIKSLSPYACLPSLNNFQKDVTPLLTFENLPNATGKYERMATVLEKVRSTLKSRFQT